MELKEGERSRQARPGQAGLLELPGLSMASMGESVEVRECKY